MDHVGPTPIDLYLGPQLIGTLINTVLYTVEVLLAATYFRSPRGKRERRGIALAVIFNLAVDTVGSTVVCISAYTFYVTFWGNANSISNTHWSLIVNIITNAITAFVVQGFLTYRFWKLSVSKTNEAVHSPRRFAYLPTNAAICITIVIFCLMLFGWGGDIHLAIRASQPRRRPEDRLRDTRDVIMALAGTAAADLAITGALIWTFDTLQPTVESGQRRRVGLPYTSSQITDEILFARPKNFISSTPSHSVPDLHHELSNK
ncbi:hypothetical protein JR316_0010818 [Psilocybe cubensis]|uniref:Uncharacterized protein n=1 Tax=Psilocybe cubensis TaxID=181762 RepID=A0ACB8GNC1_PSICU|nr:hypothetical protein JR316_0010818 [Psilocybe cubensis]KAH9476902.1 hypothetical protein JR316_0010818 [Psilocybe cubensis]